MQRKSRWHFAAALFSILDVMAAPFTNGSFEAPVINGNEDYPTSSNQIIAGWFVAGAGSLARLKGNARFGGPDPADGLQQLCFNGGEEKPGMRIYQDFDTDPGAAYTVSFRLARRGTASGSVGVNADITDTSSGETLACAFHWTDKNSYGGVVSLSFVAPSPLTRLTFTDVSPLFTNIDLLLDDVRVTRRTVPQLSAEIAVKLGFRAQPGETYQLETLSAVGGSWVESGDPITVDAADAVIYRPATAHERYFRLVPVSSGYTTTTNDCFFSRD